MVKMTKIKKSWPQDEQKEHLHDLGEAFIEIKKYATRKFDETIEVAVNLGIDTRHAEQQVRGVVQLPHSLGKEVRVAVFARDNKAEEAREAGADKVGAEDLVAEILEGKIDFDKCVATPDMMSMVGKVARILGPRGLMPNPKLKTVTPKVKEAIKSLKSGALEYRADKHGIVHSVIGKASFDNTLLQDNLSAIIQALKDSRPTGLKSAYFKKVTLSSSMGPGIKLSLESINSTG